MSDRNILSQEEIDALMNDKEEDEDDETGNNVLTSEEKDVIGEIGNIAMGSAATALYTLLDKKVEITAPEIDVRSYKEVSAEHDKPCVVVIVNYISGLEGLNLLVINQEDAAVIADLMMGEDGTDPNLELDEIHISAVGEAMNQMMGSAATSMSSIIDEMVNISPPVPEYLELDDMLIEDEAFDENQQVVSISFQLKIGDLVDSSFKQLAPLKFSKKLVARLMETGSGLTAKDENTQANGSQIQDVEMDTGTEEDAAQEEAASNQDINRESGDSAQKQPAAGRKISDDTAASGKRIGKGEGVGVKTAQFPDFNDGAAKPLPQNMELIKDVPLQVTVRLGKTRMTIEEILDLGEGSIVELEKLAGEPVDLLVNGKLIARGEVVVIDENFGFRVKDIISPMERINNL